jgi:hypothetical protein
MRDWFSFLVNELLRYAKLLYHRRLAVPVRKIPKNYRNVTGIVAGKKSEEPAHVESTLERDFVTLLEFRQDVERFEVQPVAITWKDKNGSIHRYTPDVLVFFNERRRGDGRPVLYEVKYRSEIRKNFSDLYPKFEAATEYAASHGWRFKVITERSIRTARVRNARFLLPFLSRGPIDENEMALIDTAMTELDTSTPYSLLTKISEEKIRQAELLPTLWYLVGTFQIGINLDEHITMKSKIWSVEE